MKAHSLFTNILYKGYPLFLILIFIGLVVANNNPVHKIPDAQAAGTSDTVSACGFIATTSGTPGDPHTYFVETSSCLLGAIQIGTAMTRVTDAVINCNIFGGIKNVIGHGGPGGFVAIDVINAERVQITNCGFRPNWSLGLRIRAASNDITFGDLTASTFSNLIQSADFGIAIDAGSSGNIIANNIFKDVSFSVIQEGGGIDTQVIDNIFGPSIGVAMSWSGDDGIIEGNTIEAGLLGVSFNANSNNNELSNNDFIFTGAEEIKDAGSAPFNFAAVGNKCTTVETRSSHSVSGFWEDIVGTGGCAGLGVPLAIDTDNDGISDVDEPGAELVVSADFFGDPYPDDSGDGLPNPASPNTLDASYKKRSKC